MKRSSRIRTGSAIAVIALILLTTLLGGAYYLTCYALQPANVERDYHRSLESITKNYPYVRTWVDSLIQAHALRDTFIWADDGTRLHAIYAAAQDTTSRTAVIVHGYTNNAIRMLMIGYLYHHDLHYNILLPDLRYAGKSEGDHIQMGWNDRTDVMQWMETANTLFGNSTQMVVHGISMGAATTMMLAGEPQAPYVKCFVEDCGYTSVRDQFTKELDEQFHLPSFPLIDLASWMCRLRFGWDFDEASALTAISQCHLPMLFIHGDADTYVPTRMVYELYQAKPEPKSLWVVPNAKHATSYRDNQTEYTRRVQSFTEQYIH